MSDSTRPSSDPSKLISNTINNEPLFWQSVLTPIGYVRIHADTESITSVQLLDEPSLETELPSVLTSLACEQMTSYFAGKLQNFELPLAFVGTDFQQRVWRELLSIPYGKTISYGELAEKLGDKKSVRAVGAANGKNKIPIIIPCHRVIASNGKLQGFALGLDTKRYLLNLEYQKPDGWLF